MAIKQQLNLQIAENQSELTLELVKKYSKERLMRERKNSTEFHRCLICSDIASFPVQCEGCKAIFCKKCAEKWLQQSGICPQKCSKAWNYIQIQFSQTKLNCPYSQLCSQTLFPQTYQSHLLTCFHIPTSIQRELSSKNNFMCDSNHSLSLIDGLYQQLINLPCHSCNEFKLCRSECEECNMMFCIECRPLPFVKQRCWNKKHKYVFVKEDEDAVCDVCATKPYWYYMGFYQDKICNTTICELCYEKLPTKQGRS